MTNNNSKKTIDKDNIMESFLDTFNTFEHRIEELNLVRKPLFSRYW